MIKKLKLLGIRIEDEVKTKHIQIQIQIQIQKSKVFKISRNLKDKIKIYKEFDSQYNRDL